MSKVNVKMVFAAVLILILDLPPVWAAEKEMDPLRKGPSSSECESLLNRGTGDKKFIVIPSARVPEDAKIYQDYVVELMEPGGVVDKLGIKMTGQIVEFVVPRDLNALTAGTAGGYPVRHYLDGAAVINELKPRSGFALEVVYPGPHYQHGFYRDDNPVDEQISIIDHVIGHNHFAHSSGLTGYRYGQGMLATRELDQVLERAYREANKDDVQRFYLWALTLSGLLDWYAPLLETPDKFESFPRMASPNPFHKEPLSPRHPKAPTENVLAAFISNLGVDQPSWKRQILEKIFTSMSFRPALVHTQIMNEGWASIMQEILPKHSKNNHNFTYWFGASRVMQTEAVPNLNDPYSLGVACWRHLRERFFERPEIKNLDILGKDREFIQYAEKIIATLTDETFLRLAVDQKFVDKFNLSVVQKVENYRDWKPIPPPDDPNDNWQWKIVSRDAHRVSQMIIDRVLKRKFIYHPRVKLVDFNRPASGEVELIIDDDLGVAFPLDKKELGPALFALAQIINKPISLVGTFIGEPVQDTSGWDPSWGPVPPWWGYSDKLPETYRARVTVAPSGNLTAYKLTDPRAQEPIANTPAEQRVLSEQLDEKLTKELRQNLAAYLEDLYLDDEKELERIVSGSQSLREMTRNVIQSVIEEAPYDGLLSQSPNSAGAILEFKEMLERRMAKAMAKAINSKGGFSSTMAGGMRVKVLPSIVNIGFDMEYVRKLKEQYAGERVNSMSIHRTASRVVAELDRSGPFNPDEGSGGAVGPIRGEEGDHFWGPDPRDGEGPPGPKPGEDPNDLSWIDIPEQLYERFIGERVKLPILNRKPGDSRVKATRVGASIRRKQGILLPDEIINNAIKRGVGVGYGEGIDPFDDLSLALEMGFERLQPRDIVVKSKVPKKVPDTKAVVTFVLDASGSTANYMEAFKRFVYDMEAVVRANYKGFAFKYILFDTQAHVMKTKKDFFRAQLGGGTYYSVGIKKAKEVFEKEFPRSQWDRYTFILGDMEDFDSNQAMADIKILLDNSEYFGAVAGLHGSGDWAALHAPLWGLSQSAENVGYTVISSDGTYSIHNIKEVLKNPTE